MADIDLIYRFSMITPLRKFANHWLGRCPLCDAGQCKVWETGFQCNNCASRGMSAAEAVEKLEKEKN